MTERVYQAGRADAAGNLTVSVGSTASAGVLLAAGLWELESTTDCFFACSEESTVAATAHSRRMLAYSCPKQIYSRGGTYLSAIRMTADGSLYASRVETE